MWISRRLRPWLALGSACFLLTSTPGRAQEPGTLQRGRTLTRWLLDARLDSLGQVFSPELTAAIGGREGLARLAGQLGTQAGNELAVLEETAFREGGMTSYYRVSRFEKLPSVTARWVWNSEGTVVGANITPSPEPAASEYLAYQTRTALRLPFGTPAGGMWYVAWGGRDAVHNYHVVAPDQRFAYDFIIVHGDSIHSGDGSRNEDYYCFGEPVYAPAAGTVATAVDTVADNARPGVMNPRSPPGNYVVIDHGQGEFSLLAHFRRGSVLVHPGQRVSAGEALGRCGNSGNSSLPHIHYHLQTGRAFSEGVGLPAFFSGYFLGGSYVARGEPVRGDMLLPERQR